MFHTTSRQQKELGFDRNSVVVIYCLCIQNM